MGTEDSGSVCTVWDVAAGDDRLLYECLTCGWSERAATNPGTCPECGDDIRNCSMPLE
ncbi:rubrerythrin-like domain-containing protein [Natronomonas marina]|jgi:rubrerythrin|uniref:rubrerythrin-like domain-containing protein n=1 Tax=Natronomonas marina TaxID=2961939 RepID=UPI0020C9A4E5|nr:rubrerythrin-like domain-containing protein [Natronomonas marina]